MRSDGANQARGGRRKKKKTKGEIVRESRLVGDAVWAEKGEFVGAI